MTRPLPIRPRILVGLASSAHPTITAGSDSSTIKRRKRRNYFPADQVLERLPPADEVCAAFVNEHLGGKRPRVVVRAHHEAVSPGTLDHQKLAHFRLGQRAGTDEAAFRLREDVARFASGPPTITSRLGFGAASRGTIDMG